MEKWSWFLRALAPHCKRAAAKASAHLQIQFQTCLSRQLRGHNHHRLQWKAAIIQVGYQLTVLDLVVACLWRWHKLWNRQRSHTLQWRSTRRVSFQRDREGDPRCTVGCPGCDGRSDRHYLKCQQKRIEPGFFASSSLRDVRSDVVLEVGVMSSWKRYHRLLHLLNRHPC